MAKSTRSKSKRAFRRTKRETGVYAAVDAARLLRLSNKLKAKIEADKDGDAPMEEEQVAAEGEGEDLSSAAESLDEYEERLVEYLLFVVPYIDPDELWEGRLRLVSPYTDTDQGYQDMNEVLENWSNFIGREAEDDLATEPDIQTSPEPEADAQADSDQWVFTPNREEDYWVGNEDSEMGHWELREGGVEDASGVKYAW